MFNREKRDCFRDVLRGAIVCDGGAGGAWLGLSRDKLSFLIEAHYGLTPEMLAFTAMVKPGDDSACGTSVLEHRRIVVRDIEEDYSGSFKQAALAAGVRAVTSTPLIDPHSHAVGVIALYHSRPNHPTYTASQQLDACCHVAAKVYEVFARDYEGTLSPAARQAAESVAKLLPTCGRVATKECLYGTLKHHLDIVLRGLPSY